VVGDLRNSLIRSFLFGGLLLVARDHGRCDRPSQIASLARLFPLEDTAHPLHVLSQAHATVSIFRFRGA
jgi:hypothetical protein